MNSITHIEVRRHPRWREEQLTPMHTARVETGNRRLLLALVAVMIVLTAVAVLLFS